MKIGIDCRLAGQNHAGIGRYIEELVRTVTKDTSHTWVLFFHEENQLSWIHEDTHIHIVLAPFRHYTLAEQFFLPRLYYKEKLDLLHVPHFNIPLLYTKPLVVTIHDLLWHEQKGSHVTTLSPFIYSIKYWAYKFIANQALKRSQMIFVPSQTVKDTIQKLVPQIDFQKIFVTYEGIDAKWFQKALGKRRDTKTLFYTGSLYPHKNVLLIVKALKQLSEYSLKISSSRSVFMDAFFDEVKKLGMEDRVLHVGHLSDDELIREYTHAWAFVQPSLSEGFGLPALEAMACKLPVLASDIPIFHEIYKDGFIPFDPHSVDSLVHAVKFLEKTQSDDLIKKASIVAQSYSWDRMGKEVLSRYKQLETKLQ